LVRAYLALSKSKEALFTAREAMKAMQQSAKALKLVGDVHAVNSTGREKVSFCFTKKGSSCMDPNLVLDCYSNRLVSSLEHVFSISYSYREHRQVHGQVRVLVCGGVLLLSRLIFLVSIKKTNE
jgi:hypothetical protein